MYGGSFEINPVSKTSMGRVSKVTIFTIGMILYSSQNILTSFNSLNNIAF